MRFISLDVETANEWFGSICQVGLVVFEGDRIVHEWKSYVDPQDTFSDFNTAIHGITPQIVRGAPTFPGIVKNLDDFFKEDLVVCYGHFDRTAFRQACQKHDMVEIGAQWLNLHSVVRRAWPESFGKGGYRLPKVCKHLGIGLTQHHDALSDARAAGAVFLRAQRETKIGAVEWIQKIKAPIFPSGSKPLRPSDIVVNQSGELAGEVIVFTGELSMLREVAMQAAAQLGCIPKAAVTKKTTILVVGDQDLRLVGLDGKSNKHERAEELIGEGIPIKIIGESDFMAMLR